MAATDRFGVISAAYRPEESVNDLTGIPNVCRASDFPLEGEPASSDLRAGTARLRKLIQQHIADGRYPGAQIALARHGKLALFETFGNASIGPDKAAGNDNLWLLFSNTKVITAAAIWVLAEDGLVRFSDRIADYIPVLASARVRSRLPRC
jgi:CubicO group peptidase (beta-lactamase class C family)